MHRRTGGLLAVALAAALLPGAAPADGTDCDWPMFGRELGKSFAQRWECSDITPQNVSTLALKWMVPTPVAVTASPAVVDGIVYVGDWDGLFYALDAETGEEIWTSQIDDDNNVAFGRIVSSAAVADIAGTRVVAFGGGSTVYVLDGHTGAELARACLDPRKDPDPPAEPIRCRGSQGAGNIEVESSPAIVDVDGENWIVVGHSVHNRGGIGRTGMVALHLDQDPGTGAWSLDPVWKFDPETLLTYSPDPDRDGEPGVVYTDDPLTYDAGSGQGCAGVWSSPSVNVEADRVVFGTANCTHNPATYPADEVGGEGVWGIELRSGLHAWHHVPRGVNNVDDDFSAAPNMLPGGRVGSGGKDGYYYSFDLHGDGTPEWVVRPGQSGRISSHFAIGGILASSAVGTVWGEPSVFAATAVSTPFKEPVGGPQSIDETLVDDPGRMFSLHAISAIDGRLLWRSPLSRQAYGAPTYARGVIFVPSTFDFSVKAFHADTGALLWASPLLGAPSSPPAIVGDSIYFGSGTGQSPGDPFSRVAGIWSFQLALS